MAKVTKRENFEAVLAVLEVVEATELVEFVKNELALLEKRKNAGKALTKNQLANEALKVEVLEFLAAAGEATATEVAVAVNKTVQKATALLGQLVKAGEVERVTEGKATKFKLVE